MKLGIYTKILLASIGFMGIATALTMAVYFGAKPVNPSTQNARAVSNLSNSESPTSQTPEDNPISLPPNPIPETNHANSDTKPNVAGAVTPPQKPTPAPQLLCSGQLAEKFLCLLNDYRAKNNLSKVSLNTSLTSVAIKHSEWMNSTGIFSHTGVNDSKFYDRCNVANITCRAENLAEGILQAEKLLSSWQANSGHNKNLLGPYSQIGFGVDGSYVTLLFN